MSIISISRPDLKKIINLFNRKIGLFFLGVAGLYIDGVHFSEKLEYNQILINIIMLIGFWLLYSRSTKRTKELMIYAVILGFIGEYFFSVFLGMYRYRLGNVPLYIPFGHAAVFARVYVFSKASIVKKNHKALERFLYIIISLFALGYLCFFNDVFGFIMTLGVFVLLMKRPKGRMFFLTMYIVVAVLEIGGTVYGAWKWPDTAFGIFGFLPSHNAPSGISLFYFLLDIGCFVLYTQRNKIAWSRVKNIRKINKL
ncbi:hypothetical protein KCTC32516_01280 [Polaribacter huanghezhanensis]|uniref:hypothetical protein n=1 Tax=Polaribacter huanghezhanensis TaxID=1354726 RepID=UPI0026484E17|nr:hypothetical protein [Polaribacter huanghezhanensis]WKD85931.1 hypothetical protein KCTC32516_01280 [Polaribacter huanghezhanensis]